MAGKGTTHHKIHNWTGWGVIIGLPFAVYSAVRAIGDGSMGFVDWLSNPLGAFGLLAFVTAAIWYCKLEMDEVIMDYFDGGLRRFGLFKNVAIALILWAVLAYGVFTLAFA